MQFRSLLLFLVNKLAFLILILISIAVYIYIFYFFQGKVEMTLELIPELEAKAKPVGKGQDDPNQYPHLEKPK